MNSTTRKYTECRVTLQHSNEPCGTQEMTNSSKMPNTTKHGTNTRTTDYGEHSRDDRLIIPTASLRRHVMEACHDSVFSGHFGKTRTLNLVEPLFYWPKMSRHVEDFCRGCVQCQQVKSANHSKYGGLRPLPVPEGRSV
jgi:hypothetical protein